MKDDMTNCWSVPATGNATGILVEIASEFKDPRILLFDLGRWIDYQF